MQTNKVQNIKEVKEKKSIDWVMIITGAISVIAIVGTIAIALITQLTK